MLLPMAAIAVENIRVVALFNNRAMVEINGIQRVLKVGKPSPEGVLLIEASSREAVIEIDGKRQSYPIGVKIGGSFKAPEGREVRISRSADGSYTTVGSINGRTVTLLVDTGATSVAMGEAEAKRLGIRYWLKGEKGMVRTASGVSRSYNVILDKVQIGSIVLRQVEGTVIVGAGPSEVLLGMSFLSRTEIEHRGNMMVLRTK
jgi:aspartyl protease family protein